MSANGKDESLRLRLLFCVSLFPCMFPLLVREFDRSFVPRAFIAASLLTTTLSTIVLCAQHIQEREGMTTQMLREVSLSFLVLGNVELLLQWCARILGRLREI